MYYNWSTMMLRDYEYTENWRLLDPAVAMFIDLPPRLSLVGYTALSPDSFIWKIFDGTAIYYLYAEDYVPSLDHVRQQVKEFWPEDVNLEFIPVKHTVAFEDSSPVRSADVYQPPENEQEFMKYAGQSGHDFVFLMRSSEKFEERIPGSF